MDHETKEWEVTNFHGQTSDGYAYVWMVPGSLFSWITLWHLCHTLNRCKVAYYTIYIGTWRNRIKANTSQHNFFITWDRSHEVFHEYKLPCICPVYDIGFKVLSMKINYFHGQTSDGYAYVWMVPGSLFSWITLWHLCHTLNRCKVAYFHGKRHDSYPM
jgi:hypothetical protein